MNFPIYLKSKHVKHKSYIMIASMDLSIEVDTDELTIENHRQETNMHFLQDSSYEIASCSEFQLAFVGVTSTLKNIITTTEVKAA